MNKLLFLDIDGVLNHVGSYIYVNEKGGQNGGACWDLEHCEFCPISCSNLRYIMKEIPDLKIVISSTWRILEWEKLMELLRVKAGLDVTRIIGKTPRLRDKNWDVERGQEIQQWLEEHFEDTDVDIVIVDDDSDMGPLMDKLVKTDNRDGLTFSKAQEIMVRLRKDTVKCEQD